MHDLDERKPTSLVKTARHRSLISIFPDGGSIVSISGRKIDLNGCTKKYNGERRNLLD